MLATGEDGKQRIRLVSIKKYNLSELARIYKISRFRMREQLKHVEACVGKKKGYNYNEVQVALIFYYVTLPPDVHIIPHRSNL